MACIFVLIGRHSTKTDRFDGQTLFTDVNNRNFITLEPLSEMSPFTLYLQFLYLSAGTMGAVMYGDSIPYTLPEQLFNFVAMFWARIYLAFMFAESANFLQQLHVLKSVHHYRTKRIEHWMKQNGYPSKLVERVNNYHAILWEDFRGLNERQVM